MSLCEKMYGVRTICKKLVQNFCVEAFYEIQPNMIRVWAMKCKMEHEHGYGDGDGNSANSDSNANELKLILEQVL